MKNIKFFATTFTIVIAIFGTVSVFGQNKVQPIPMTTATPSNTTVSTSATPTATPNGKLTVNPVPQNGDTTKGGTVNSCPTVTKRNKVVTPCSIKTVTKPGSNKPGCDLCGGLGKLDKNEKDILAEIRKGNEQNHTDHEETVGLLNKLVTGVESIATSIAAIPDKLSNAAGLGEISNWLKWIFWAMVIGFIAVLFFLIWRTLQGSTANGYLHQVRDTNLDIRDGVNGHRTDFAAFVANWRERAGIQNPSVPATRRNIVPPNNPPADPATPADPAPAGTTT